MFIKLRNRIVLDSYMLDNLTIFILITFTEFFLIKCLEIVKVFLVLLLIHRVNHFIVNIDYVLFLFFIVIT